MIKRIITGIIVGTVLMFVGRSMPKAEFIAPDNDYTFTYSINDWWEYREDFVELANYNNWVLFSFSVPEDTHNLINNTICLGSLNRSNARCVNLNDYSSELALNDNTKWGIKISPNNYMYLFVTNGSLPSFINNGSTWSVNVDSETLFLQFDNLTNNSYSLYLVTPSQQWQSVNQISMADNQYNYNSNMYYSNTTWHYNYNDNTQVNANTVDWGFSFETLPEFKTTFSTVDSSKYNNNVVSDVQFTINYKPSDLERFVAEFGFVEGDPLQLDEEDYSYDNLGYFTDPIHATTTYPVNNNGVVCIQIKKTNDGRVVYRECWDIDSIGKPLVFNNKPDKTQNTINSFINDINYGGPISSIVLLPINIIEGILTAMNLQCTPYRNGKLLGKVITFPCVTLSGIVGNDLADIIDVFGSFSMAIGFIAMVVEVYRKATALEDLEDYHSNTARDLAMSIARR